MTSFVLVHGGAHGAWCWSKLVPHLEGDPRVEAVVAVDLAGHGERRDVKPQADITLADYVDDVAGAIESRDLSDVVLVGHSLAGITLPPAAARVAPRLRRVVFLSTSNPKPGQSIMELMAHPLSPLARGLEFEAMFCNDLDPETSAWLRAHVGPEPPAPMTTPVEVATAPEGVPATYVLLERDQALPPAFQREQARTACVDEVVPFDAGHSAFASRPAALAALLLGWA